MTNRQRKRFISELALGAGTFGRGLNKNELEIADGEAVVAGAESLEGTGVGGKDLAVIDGLGVVDRRADKARGTVGHGEVRAVGMPAAERVALDQGGGDFGWVHAVLAGAHEAFRGVGAAVSVFFEMAIPSGIPIKVVDRIGIVCSYAEVNRFAREKRV